MVSSSFGWIFVLIRIFISKFLRSSFLLLYTLLHAFFFFSPTCYWFPWLRNALRLQVSALIFIRLCAWRRSPNIKTQKNLVEKKQKKAQWKTEAQQHLQVFWTIFPLLFLNAAFLMLCSLLVPVFFSGLFSLCLFCLKCGAIWSILMVHDDDFNFLIHPCWRQNCSTLKCCLWAHIDVRGDDVFVLLLYLKLLSSFLREMTTFIIILDGRKTCTVQNQLESINDNNLQDDADNY